MSTKDKKIHFKKILNFHLVACEFSLLMFQLGHDHEKRFYHATVKRTVRLKKDHEHIETDLRKTLSL